MTQLNYLRIIFCLLANIFLANCRDILTQIQLGSDESTISNPITFAGEKTVDIIFKDSYSNTPTVLIYITSISVLKSNLQNYKVEAQSITSKGFKLSYQAQFNGVTISFKVQWIAFESTSVAEVIYKEINGINLSDSSLSVTTRSDQFTISFQNTYTSIPNVALFLLGLSSKEDSTDTVNIGQSEVTTSNCKVSVSSWNSGMLDKAFFAVFVIKQDMSISQSGKQSNIVGGSIDNTSVWMDTTKSNRVLTLAQTTSKNLTASSEDGSLITTLSGIKGYDVRQNLSVNLKINLSSFASSTFQQSVETWGQSQIVAGYWDSVAINTTTNSLSSLDDSSGFAWWLILIIFLVVIIAIVIVIILIIYCERRKKRLAKEAEEEKNAKNEVKEEQKNQIDLSQNDSKNQDQSILKSKMNQDNTQSIMIKDIKEISLIYNDDYINHKDNQHQNTKRDNGNISYLNNTNFISPKNTVTENNLDNNQKVIDLEINSIRQDQSSNQFIKQNTVTQQNSQQDSNLQYYRNPRKQYENVNHLKDDEDDKIQQILDNRDFYYNMPQTTQNQQKQDQEQLKQIGNTQKQQQNSQSQNVYQNEKNGSQIQKQNDIQQSNQKPIDKTINDVEHHINNYKKDQQIQDVNQSMLSQDVEQNDELRQMKKSNYDVYRQILLNKQKFDNQQNEQTPGPTPYQSNNVDQKINSSYYNNNNNNYHQNHLLNNRYNIPDQSNNIYSNSSTHRPLQHSSRVDEQQQNFHNPQGRNHMSQIGNMIVNGNSNNNLHNNNDFNNKKYIDTLPTQNSQNFQGKSKEIFLNVADSPIKNQHPLNINQKGSDYLSVEDDDMPRRPRDNNVLPLI